MFKKLCNPFFDLKKMYKIIIFISICTSFFIFGALTAYASTFYSVKIFINNERVESFKTTSKTVEDILEERGITLDAKDYIDTALDLLICEDTQINIIRANRITFNIEGEDDVTFTTNEKYVLTALESFEEETGRQFVLKNGQSPAKDITDGMTIYIIPYEENIEVISTEIPFETVYVDNPNLLIGTENITTEGYNGTKQTTIKKTYLGGTLTSTEVVSEVIDIIPVNQVIERGTKNPNTITIDGQTFTYSSVLTMTSTAYTAGVESTGKNPGDPGYGITASGLKAERGVVAVDTSVIPLGTQLYVEGYGYAIAADTGSAIKGDKIDVFIDSYNEAIQWGVRDVTVYILE